MGKSNCPGQSKPEKICGTCRYFNPEFPVNGKPAPVCLAIKEMKGGTEYSNPRGTQHYFRCSNGRYEIGISNQAISPGNKAGVLPFICEREQTVGNVPEKP